MLISVFGVKPVRIGGTETFARELSLQLGERGWNSVLCFLSEPTAEVRRFLDLPNISFEVLADSTDGSRTARRDLARIMRKYRADILHLHYVSFLNFYSWGARFKSARKVFFTDHHSRSAGHVRSRSPFWKRAAARLINQPLTKVICVSNYGYECMTAADLLPRNRFQMIYNGVDLSRVKADPLLATKFKERYSIPGERAIVTQVSWLIPEKGIADFAIRVGGRWSASRAICAGRRGDGTRRSHYLDGHGG
jgi:glycosyltransferase involved in cell wall biosynthesis